MNQSQDKVVLFLKSLEENQRSKAMMDFNNLGRERWHYLPTDSWYRAGINFKELNQDQKILAHDMLKSYLSKSGYEKVISIIDLENVLAEIENNPVKRDSELYFIAVYGDPEHDATWSWHFEGHHISLHFSVVDGAVAFTPRFLGANPAIVKSGSKKGLKTLYEEQSLGLQLINALSKDQKEKAIIQETAYIDVATMNAMEVGPFVEKGIAMMKLDGTQRVVLMSIIKEYLSSIPEEIAEERMKKIEKEESEHIYFAWTGATELGKAHYYRIQGETFLLEFDNAQNGANHIHTVWREFDGDFGRDLIREHRMNHKH